MDKIKIALLGVGTVGKGFYDLLSDMKCEIANRTNCEIEIKYILVRDKNKKKEGVDSSLFVDDYNVILEDEEIQIVVELIGGTNVAKDYILKALDKKKHIVTANKDLLAEAGEEIFSKSKENGCDIQFEAAVAGAIPIVRPMMQNMASDSILEVMGIVNGTTNYILTKMYEEGMSYEEALLLATELGYAEADPTADVEGLDAARKIAIIAQLVYHTNVTLDDVYKEGITKITFDDIKYAKDCGYVIKLIGTTKLVSGKVEAKVTPMLLPFEHPLASVRDSFNGIFVKGRAMDDAMFMGRGAGEYPTASAVLGDVIDVTRNILNNSCGRVAVETFKDIPILDIKESKSKFFLRLKVVDIPGVLAKIATTIGNHNVGFLKVIQMDIKENVADLVFILGMSEESNVSHAICELKKDEDIVEICSLIRVY